MIAITTSNSISVNAGRRDGERSWNDTSEGKENASPFCGSGVEGDSGKIVLSSTVDVKEAMSFR